MDVAYVSDGNQNGPKGVRGGESGALSSQFRVNRDGAREALPNTAVVTLAEGERIASYSCGGGGYGPPVDREPHSVARDVAEGWISAERAETVYRVAVDAAGVLDAVATDTLRRSA